MLRNSSARRAAGYPMQQGYSMNDIKRLLKPSDVFLTRTVSARSNQFFSWQGMPHKEVAASLLKMPEKLRTAHVIFGRQNVPMDIALDLDMPVPADQLKSIRHVEDFQSKLLTGALDVVKTTVEDQLKEKIESCIVLRSPSMKKASYHIHIRMKDAWFHDFRTADNFAWLVKENPAAAAIDTNIFRESGSLRLFQNAKRDKTSPLELVPSMSFHTGLTAGQELTPETVMELALTVREPHLQLKQVVVHAPKSKLARQAEKVDASTLPPVPTSAREWCDSTITAINALPPEEAAEWKDWITTLLMAKRIAEYIKTLPMKKEFDPNEEIMQAFMAFSRKVPEKFAGYGRIRYRWKRTEIDDNSNDAARRSYYALYKRGVMKASANQGN